MSGDSKIGLQVGGVVRTAPVRKLGASIAVASAPASRAAAPEPSPAASLIRLAAELAAQPAPVDGARVAALRDAIAGGSYAVDPGAIARAMLEHHQGSAE